MVNLFTFYQYYSRVRPNSRDNKFNELRKKQLAGLRENTHNKDRDSPKSDWLMEVSHLYAISNCKQEGTDLDISYLMKV